MHIFLLTAIAMVAFAANSVLARLALVDGAIDPSGFTLVRLASGALVLWALAHRGRAKSEARLGGNWPSAFALFAYAAGFSFAYVALPTGTGAVILFAMVQITMIGWALIKGDRPILLEWIGLLVAFGALVWLVSPGIEAPDPMGALLMGIAGIAWGIYSVRGQTAHDPLQATAGNFIRATPFAIVVMLVFAAQMHLSLPGIILACISGAVTSGLGYALWYRVLGQITATQAGIVQLSVPAIAAIGGVVFGGEILSLRFIMSCTLILGGVALAIVTKRARMRRLAQH